MGFCRRQLCLILRAFLNLKAVFSYLSLAKEKIGATGKNVAIIGRSNSDTGYTGNSQGSWPIVVYQRNPNWCAPLNNGKISKTKCRYTRRYPEILERCKNSGCYIHSTDPEKLWRLLGGKTKILEKLYASQDLVFGKVILTICLWIGKQMIWRVVYHK